jgi:hypothetical protein
MGNTLAWTPPAPGPPAPTFGVISPFFRGLPQREWRYVANSDILSVFQKHTRSQLGSE